MFNLEDLRKYQVAVVENPIGVMTVYDAIHHHFDQVLAVIQENNDASNDLVATSIFMRRYGLFISALLFLKAHNKVWEGSLQSIHLEFDKGNISFKIDSQLIRDERENDLNHILDYYCRSVIEVCVQRVHISKYVLWENLWGYILWMYSHVGTDQAKKDLAILLEDNIWQPKNKTSIFRKFLGNQTFEESSTKYKRLTCCLLKEIPGTKECPYCPHSKN